MTSPDRRRRMAQDSMRNAANANTMEEQKTYLLEGILHMLMATYDRETENKQGGYTL